MRLKPNLIIFVLVLPFFFIHDLSGQAVDSVLVNHLHQEARRTFRSGQFEENIVFTDSLCMVYKDIGDLKGYAIFSMYNGWTCASQLKDYERASFYAGRALATVENDLQGQLPYLDDLYALWSTIYAATGNPEKALDYNYLTLQTVAALQKTNTFADFVAHHNLGTTYLEVENWPAALPFLEKARAIILQVAEKDGWNPRLYIFAAQLQAHLSFCYQGMEDYPRALAEAQAGLPYTEAGERPDHFTYHEIYLALAESYARNGQPEEAEAYFQLLEKIYLEFFGAQSAYMASLYQKRSEQAFRQRLLPEALALNTQALTANGLIVAPDQLSLERDLSRIRCRTCEPGLYEQRIDLLWALSQEAASPQPTLEACLSTADLALTSLQEMRKTISYQEGDKQALFSQFQSILKTSSLAAQELYQITRQPAYLERAFALAEQGKANLLLEALVLSRAEAYYGLPASILSKERSLGLQLVRQEKLFEDARNDRDTIRAEEIRNGGLFTAKRQYEAFLQQLKADYPQYFAARHEVQVVSLPSLQRNLEPKDLFLSYLLNTNQNTLQIFAVAEKRTALVTVPWPSDYSRQIEQYYRSLQQASLVQTNKRKAFIEKSHQLYQVLLKPVEGLFEGKSRLIIAADDVLHYLPFETLLPSAADGPFEELDFIIRQLAVSYQYSGTVLLESQRKAMPATDRLLAFAPVFQEEASTGQLAARTRSLLDTTLASVRNGRFSPLPWSEKEVLGIQALFPPGKTQVLLREEASEGSLKNAMEGAFRYLHLASHSFVNRKNARFSGIACAQPGENDTEEDGVLYTNEIYRQNLTADLVILSSCESGIGNLTAGEGMLGINRSFIYAGAPNVLYSLWKVDDQRSSELMLKFYETLLAGQPYYEALRQAKLSLLHDKNTALPLYWSAFSLIGR